MPFRQAAAPGQFSDRTARLGVHFQHQASPTSRKYLLETMGSGVALLDYDNDGRLDIFFANGALIPDPMPKGGRPRKSGPQYWNRLFHQTPDGGFEDVTESAGLQGNGFCTGVAVGDYDNDGLPDLYVTGYGRNTLYHNNGDGTFTDVTSSAGVAGGGWSTSAAWVDYDNDGRLDLIVARYMVWDFEDIYCGSHLPGHRAYCHPDLFQPISVLLYHNDGNGKFTEVSRQAGLTKKCKGLGVAIADFDHDGFMDIFVANDSIEQTLFRNKGDGTFEEVAMMSGVAVDGDGNTFAGMGVDFSDYNNDGWEDLIITDLANQTYALYTNSGDGSFRYDTNAAELGAMTRLHSGWGVRFMDYDNDGWKDLFVAQGHVMDTINLDFPNLHYRESPLLARNAGRRFVDASSQAGAVFQQRWPGRGLAIGDLNNDGRLDAVITTNNGAAHVLMNQTETRHHWISLQLEGVKSNRDGIGARIQVATSHGRQYATVTTAGSYQSSSDRRVHFGLGQALSIDTIEIRWPSGVIQTIRNLKPDQFLKIRESA